ncbi:MAG TPA: type IV pilin protein [Telluria sp.]|nr:type IV pilin protein [Telluria sp.]
MQRQQQGITLIELMITLAIIGIVSSIALPSYRDYVTRGRLAEAFSTLGSLQPNAEQFWSNKRTFEDMNVAPSPFPADTPNFTSRLTSASPAAYLVTATGRGTVNGFAFTIDQQGNRKTTAVPDGWTANTTCWVDRRGGSCTQ